MLRKLPHAAPFLFPKYLGTMCNLKITFQKETHSHLLNCGRAGLFLFPKKKISMRVLFSRVIFDIPSYSIMVHGVLPPSCSQECPFMGHVSNVFSNWCTSLFSARAEVIQQRCQSFLLFRFEMILSKVS